MHYGETFEQRRERLKSAPNKVSAYDPEYVGHPHRDEFAKFVQDRRKALRLTVQDVGIALGKPMAVLSQIETARLPIIDDEIINDIQTGLNVKITVKNSNENNCVTNNSSGKTSFTLVRGSDKVIVGINPTKGTISFGMFVNQCRIASGLSMRDLAKAANLRRDQIFAIEGGYRELDNDMIKKLCIALNVDETDAFVAAEIIPPDVEHKIIANLREWIDIARRTDSGALGVLRSVSANLEEWKPIVEIGGEGRPHPLMWEFVSAKIPVRLAIDSLSIERRQNKEIVDNFNPDFTKAPNVKKLIADAIKEYNNLPAECRSVKKAGIDSPQRFLHMISVNRLRHAYTEYDSVVQKLNERGARNEFERTNQKVFEAIVLRYPELEEECLRQMEEKLDDGIRAT